MIRSEDDVPLCMDGLDEAERERSFPGSENMERTLAKKGLRLPPFFKSGA